MNASVPPGWRPSFTAKQSRSIVSGAWARGRKRWGFFRYSSFSSSFTTFRSLFLTASVFSGRTPVGLFLQLDATACPDFPHFRFVSPASRPAPRSAASHGSRPVLLALWPVLQPCAVRRAFVLRPLPSGQASQEQLNVCSWN